MRAPQHVYAQSEAEQRLAEVEASLRLVARRPEPVPSLRDLVPVHESVIPIAYGDLVQASSDLMDHAMKHATEEEAAVIYHLAQAMVERMGVLKELAETRLKRFSVKGA